MIQLKAMDAVYYYSESKLQVVLKKAWDEAKDQTTETWQEWLETLAAEHKAVADQGLAELNVAPE